MEKATREEIAEIVTDAVRAVMAAPEIHCRYSFDPEKHDLEHEALRRFIRVVGRIEDVKWGTLQKLIVTLIVGAFGLMVYGGLMKLQILGGLGWPGR